MMWSAAFWRDALERAVKTAAQAIVALLVTGVTVIDIDWAQAAAVAGTAALVSVLMSVVSSGIGDPDSASVVPRRGGE